MLPTWYKNVSNYPYTTLQAISICIEKKTFFKFTYTYLIVFFFRYSAFADKLGAAVTSYKAHNNSTEFVEALHKSFLDITKLLSG